jgi:predicted nuclease of restriction endonuclease-like (RecB) superfamily
VEFEQAGSDRAAYGEGLLKRVAKDLTASNVPGCGVRMLERMRAFYLDYPQLAGIISSPAVTRSDKTLNIKSLQKSSPVVTISQEAGSRLPSALPPERVFNLSWTHVIELLGIEDPWKRAFYENECIKGGWSKRQLQRQIASLLYERTGLSTDKQAVIERARQQALDAPTDIAGLIRDPYVLEFVGLSERPHYLENDLERALLDHIQQFLLELGTGFCFEARQRRITVGNEHDRIDLVFYHRVLRCHLLIDLKVRAFQHTDAGQMNFYLNYWKDQVMIEGDNPPVGLLLCTDKENTKVEYATAGLDQQLFVSRYKVVLPKAEDLERLIEEDRAAWEQHHRREH